MRCAQQGRGRGSRDTALAFWAKMGENEAAVATYLAVTASVAQPESSAINRRKHLRR